MTNVRKKLGLNTPGANTIVTIQFMEGLNYYIKWISCPDRENILYAWIKSRSKAHNLVKENNWKLLKK